MYKGWQPHRLFISRARIYVGTMPFLFSLVFARDKRTVTTCSFALYSVPIAYISPAQPYSFSQRIPDYYPLTGHRKEYSI